MTSLYGSGVFYGSGAKYVGAPFSPDEGIPEDLRFYRTSQDGIYVFWWGFSPEFITPSLAFSAFDLQLDTSPLFTSPNLVTFTSSIDTTASLVFTVTSVTDATHLVVSSTTGMSGGDNIRQGSHSTTITTVTDGTHLVVASTAGWVASNIITFQNGNVRKGFAVSVAARQEGIVQTWYARVRTHTPSFVSDWSFTLTWTIPQKVQQQYAEALMNSLPDSHVYGKGDLLKPLNQRNTNLWLVEDMYGNQFDQVYYANFLTQTDNYITLCVDENLFQNFGVLFSFPKPNSMQYVDYRWILMNLIQASLVGSTNEAIILTVQAFTGVPPDITPIRDENDFFLVTIQDNPIVPSGPQTVFHTSQPYIDASLVVEDITTGLLVPSSAYTTDGVQATWTMNVATTDTLQAIFDVGNPLDPFPVIFDALNGATTLTGLVTFTNGSNNIGGSGTLFTSQLVVGNEITDPYGIYLGTIAHITDNTHAQLVNPWGGPTEVNTAYKLLYTDSQLPPPILWDQSTLKAGVLITIFNPGEFALT